jgi:hypothetical protein
MTVRDVFASARALKVCAFVLFVIYSGAMTVWILRAAIDALYRARRGG